jgi:sugar lactone lactonase YvrE
LARVLGGGEVQHLPAAVREYAVTDTGVVYFSDTTFLRLHRWNADGSVTDFEVGGVSSGLRADGERLVWVTEFHKLVEAWPSSDGKIVATEKLDLGAEAAALVEADGHWYFTTQSGPFRRISSDGWIREDLFRWYAANQLRLQLVDEHHLVANLGERLFMIDTRTGLVSRFLTHQARRAVGFFVDGKDVFYVVETGGTEIWRVKVE